MNARALTDFQPSRSDRPMGILIGGVRVDAVDYNAVCDITHGLIQNQQSGYIVAANTHSIVEARDSEVVRRAIAEADVVTPDGRPLVWCLRKSGFTNQEAANGPTVMIRLLELAEKNGWKVGFYGSTNEILGALQLKMLAQYPNLKISYVYSPPFQVLTADETADVRQAITTAGVDLLFVALGCPNQEKWMATEVKHLHCVMAGVGAAFAFHAGLVKRAPDSVSRMGFEWLFRLSTEPKRLWKRYFRVIPRFLLLAATPKSITKNVPQY